MKRKAHFKPQRGRLKTVRRFECHCGRIIEFVAMAKVKRPRCRDARIELTVSGGAIV